MWLIRFSGGGKETLRQALLMLRDTLFEGGRMARHTGKQNEENGWTLCKPADYVSGKVMARTIRAARVPVYPSHSVTQNSSARDIEATLAPLTTEKGGGQENKIKTGVFTRSKARMAYFFIATCAALPLLVSFLNCKCNYLTHACSSLRDYLSCSIVSDYSWQLVFLPRAPKFLSISYLFILVVPLLRCAQEVITQLPLHPPFSLNFTLRAYIAVLQYVQILHIALNSVARSVLLASHFRKSALRNVPVLYLRTRVRIRAHQSS